MIAPQANGAVTLIDALTPVLTCKQEIAEPPAPALVPDDDAIDVDGARRGLDDLFNLYEAPQDD